MTPRTPKLPGNQVIDLQRFGTLEANVHAIGENLDAFVTESKEHRNRAERNETQIWNAIREQGERMNLAVEKLSNNGRISWGMIVSTGGFLVAVIAAGAGVNHALTESRMKQVEIRIEYHQRELDRGYEEGLWFQHQKLSQPALTRAAP